MIDEAMMLYGVSEAFILSTWSLETLIQKVRHGFRFELLKRGFYSNDDDDELREPVMSDCDIVAMYR